MDKIKDYISKLKEINYDDFREELKKYGFQINNDKFFITFSCYGATKLLLSLDLETFKGGINYIPQDILKKIRVCSVVILRAYSTFVYMRSDELENKLNNVENNSCLNIYKEIFRKGTKKDNSDTLAQHIRNSLCHGTFCFNDNLTEITFIDKDPYSKGEWKANISVEDFDFLCKSIYIFYEIVFEELILKNKWNAPHLTWKGIRGRNLYALSG